MQDPKLEAGIEAEVSAALERVREDRDRREMDKGIEAMAIYYGHDHTDNENPL